MSPMLSENDQDFLPFGAIEADNTNGIAWLQAVMHHRLCCHEDIVVVLLVGPALPATIALNRQRITLAVLLHHARGA